MANKFTTKVTNEGLNLLQLASQQDKKVEFINVIASSTAYSENQLISETYDDINSRASKNQTGTINNLTIDKNITKMELVFDGHDIKSDYTLNSIFLIAKLKDSQDLKLFAIIKANQPQYMNSYDGSGSTNLQINLGVKFSNNDKVTLQIDTAAIATLGDLSNLRNETQAKLDKETTRATEKEKNLALDIETEKNRAIKAENTLQTNIDTIDSRAQSEEKKLSNKLDTETTRAIQSEQELQGKVETEKNRAQSKEDELKSLINSNKQTLNETVLNEQNRAIQAEENLQSKITSEQNRAMTKENSLDSKIVQANKDIEDQIKDETTRAQSEEKRIDDKINYLTNNKSIKEVTVNDMNDLVQEGIYFSKKQLNNLDTRFAGENNFIIITGNQDYISQIVITELSGILSRYREDGEWSEWTRQIRYKDLEKLPLNEINPDINDLVETVSEIKGRQNRPPTGYALDTSTKPWTIWFDNGCGIQYPSYYNNPSIYGQGNIEANFGNDLSRSCPHKTMIRISNSSFFLYKYTNREIEVFVSYDKNIKVINPIRTDADKFDWSRCYGNKNTKSDGTFDEELLQKKTQFARAVYEVGIWSEEDVIKLGAVRKV